MDHESPWRAAKPHGHGPGDAGIRFTPATVELTVGGTVTFEFGTVPHNVFFDNAPPGAPENIPAPTTRRTVTLTFPSAGQYRYNCHLHPGMTGTVNVR